MKFLLFATLAVVANAFTGPVMQRPETKLHLEIDRRTFASALTGAVLGSSVAADALDRYPSDNEVIVQQRQSTNKIDINNAAVADYMLLPGMYPKIGGMIATNGPYKNVNDIYKIKGLTGDDKATIKKHEKIFTARAPQGDVLDPMRGRDPYRSSFNQFASITNE